MDRLRFRWSLVWACLRSVGVSTWSWLCVGPRWSGGTTEDPAPGVPLGPDRSAEGPIPDL